MHYFIYPDKDTTLYEVSQSINTGLDEILEIRKDMNNSGSVINVSRILIQFDLSKISSSIVNGIIPESAKYYLNMYDANPILLSTDQTLYVYPISQSWTMGMGKTTDWPITKEGVSWAYRTGKITADTWVHDVLDTGGTWYSGSGYEASQSFNHETTDFRSNVTDIVNLWLNGTINNNGFIIKRSGSIGNNNSNVEEGNTTQYGNFKFFSRDTHTIYSPKLEIIWDSSEWTTGSLSPLTGSDLNNPIIYMKGLHSEYKENSKVKFKVVGRPQYPAMTWATTPALLKTKYLPSGSTTSLDGTYYSIKDAYTEDIIIPYGTGSIVSCDSTGNYFTAWLNGFQPERFYKIEFKIVSGSGTVNETVQYIDNDFSFKVVR